MRKFEFELGERINSLAAAWTCLAVVAYVVETVT